MGWDGMEWNGTEPFHSIPLHPATEHTLGCLPRRNHLWMARHCGFPRHRLHRFSHNPCLQRMDCQNGIVFAWLLEGWEFTPEVHHPLCSDKGMPIFPPFPRVQDRNLQRFNSILSKEEEGRTSYLYVLGEYTNEGGKSMTRVYMLQDGVWRMHTSVTCQLCRLLLDPQAVFGNKIFFLSF